MPKQTYQQISEVTVYPGMGGWRFVSIGRENAQEIKEKYKSQAKGWGSLPVTANIGKTTWETSIFPDKKSGSYLLPLKVQVRKSEGIQDGDRVSFSITLR